MTNLKDTSRELNLADIDTYLYFEENSYWAGIIYETLCKESVSRKVQLVICTDAIVGKLNRHGGWVRSQGGFFVNWNGLKLLARLAFQQIPSLRPSRILAKQLQDNKNVKVVILPKIRKRDLASLQEEFCRAGRTPSLSQELLDNIVALSLGEDKATEHIELYMKAKKVALYTISANFMASKLDQLLGDVHVSHVVYMNGRTLYERVAYEVCKKRKLISYALEINADGTRVQKFSGTAVNSDFYSKAIEDFWECFVQENGRKLAEDIGSQFFNVRRIDKKVNQFLRLFGNEDKNYMDKKDVREHFTFFTSSNEELKSLYSIYGGKPISQNKLILELIEFFSKQPNIKSHLTIRIHPNTRRKREADKLFFDSLSASNNVSIIGYSDGTNSYELIESSDVVITAGSTVGLEAAYMGKRSLTFARTLWEGLDCSVFIEAVEDLQKPMDIDTGYARLQAIKYGLFMMKYGSEFEYFDLFKLRTYYPHVYFDQISRFKRPYGK